MGYRNAQEIFPEGLLRQIQRYVSGETIYVPARKERKSWGESSGYQQYIRERNTAIRAGFSERLSIEDLSARYALSYDTIRRIVYSRREINMLKYSATLSSAKAYAEAEKLDAWIHPDDRRLMVSSGQWCAELGLSFKPFSGQLHDLSDGDVLTFGQSSLRVIATPGHTPGGVCFFCEEAGVLFSGDTLFAGSIGRTDTEGGDYDQLIGSIVRKILPHDGDVTVLPGHGPATSVGYERATNPFLHSA